MPEGRQSGDYKRRVPALQTAFRSPAPMPDPSLQAPPSILVAGRLLIDPERAPEPGWILVRDGRIEEIHSGDAPSEAPGLIVGGRDRLICPAFTDAHCHLPQFPVIGADGLGLLEWLERVVYPAEGSWGRGGALAGARRAVGAMAREGTAGFAAFLTSHAGPGADVLSWLEQDSPMRAIAGRVAMDRNAPDDLIASDRAGGDPDEPADRAGDPGTENRVRRSLNPRFAPACTGPLLEKLGRGAADRWVQTHLSESVEEVELVGALFPDAPSYTEVYDEFGLLTPRTLLAHCVHLTDREWAVVARRDSIAVHCPTANTFLRSGRFNLDKAREFGVRVALGSDVAAGADIAMPRVARAMIETAKHRAMGSTEPVSIPTPAQAWDMITRTNAQELGWSGSGVISRAAAADLLVLRPPESWFDEHLIGRLLYGWESGLIETRVFNGGIVRPDTI